MDTFEASTARRWQSEWYSTLRNEISNKRTSPHFRMIDDTDLGEFVRGKWYEPITSKIEEFEESGADVFPEVAAIAEPNSPEWAVQCAIKGMKPFGNLVGVP